MQESAIVQDYERYADMFIWHLLWWQSSRAPWVLMRHGDLPWRQRGWRGVEAEGPPKDSRAKLN